MCSNGVFIRSVLGNYDWGPGFFNGFLRYQGSWNPLSHLGAPQRDDLRGVSFFPQPAACPELSIRLVRPLNAAFGALGKLIETHRSNRAVERRSCIGGIVRVHPLSFINPPSSGKPKRVRYVASVAA